jgi:hypothetical protein
MLRLVAVLAVLLVTPALGAAQSLEGVWRGTEVEIVNGPNAGVTVLERPRLLNFTDAYFFLVFENEGDPRPTGQLSDDQILQASLRMQAWAGTYMRDGVDIIYNRHITINPNGMLPEAQPLVRQIRTLTRRTLETQGTNADGITTVLRYTRVE